MKNMNNDSVSRQGAIDVVHKAIFDFFDIVEDDSESPITYQDERLLELNKSITQKIKALPSVQETKLDEWCKECKEYCPNCGARMEGADDV